uniref:hypothetical protein n=1 Tax=Pantoea sp. IMH TaxID=1267600 RepID=UPI0004685CC9|nr:hypothetical protein [Pantoea sp. IMH]
MKRLRKAARWLLCLVMFTSAVACAGEKSASGKIYPGIKTQQVKPVLTHGKDREKVSSASGSAADNVVVVENNFLGITSSEKLDSAIEKIKQGDKSLANANEVIKQENANKISDVLMTKFRRDPSSLSESEKIALNSYVRAYAAEMQAAYGADKAEQIVHNLFAYPGYERNPDNAVLNQAQSIVNTWGYHKSNASIGDAPLIFSGSVLGLTVKGMATNAAIGVGVNAGVQLAGKDPFSYVDAIMAGVTAAATTGKGIIASTPVNMGGAAIGSSIKGEDPTNAVIGAGFGSVAGGIAGKIASEVTKPVVKETTSEVSEAVVSSITSEVSGNKFKEQLDHGGNE